MERHSFLPSALRSSIIAVTALVLMTITPSSVARAQYTGNENHVVPLDTAVHLVQNFRAKPVAPPTKGGYFGRNIFEKILAQRGSVGIRYYYATKDDGTPTIVLVGVDSTGNDMVKGVVGEVGIPCPPYCSTSNALSK